MFRTVISEESTTLPEGAIISMCRVRYDTSKKAGATKTELQAKFRDQTVTMKMDNVSAVNMRQYLDLTVRQIKSVRQKVESRADGYPEDAFEKPEDMDQFVLGMLVRKMFLRHALDAT